MSKGKAAVKATKAIVKTAVKKKDWIMMVLALLGLVGTTALAVKATVTAVKMCETKEVKDGKEIIRTVWRLYIPAVGCFLVTTMSIVGLGWTSIKRARELATVTGLYAMSQTDLKDLKSKAKEFLGEKKEREKIEDEIAKDKLNEMVFPPEEQIYKTGHGNKLFVEHLTGQLIRTSPEWVEAVNADIKTEFHKQPDNIVEVSYYLSKFNISTDCWVAEAFWDYAELMRRYGEFEIDCHELQWMEVNGVQEMVGIIAPPYPTGV